MSLGGMNSAASMVGHHAVDEAHSIATAAGHVLVAIPAFDEDRFIGSLVLKLRARGHAVVVVDDGSSDSTGDIAEAAGALVIRHPLNLGKSAAVKTVLIHCWPNQHT